MLPAEGLLLDAMQGDIAKLVCCVDVEGKREL